MTRLRTKSKAFFRAHLSGAFDQYLQDIQKLPLIQDPAEERRLARRARRGDAKAAERLVTWRYAFVLLAFGPAAGIWAMLRLRRLPASARMASGRR